MNWFMGKGLAEFFVFNMVKVPNQPSVQVDSNFRILPFPPLLMHIARGCLGSR
jgi:hypothetical protein